MCDSVAVVVEGGPVWFAKNSDREPTEAQFVEYHDAPADALVASDQDIAPRPKELPRNDNPVPTLISRPTWMWGCEMGLNQAGVAIGNEAVFTRLPVAREGVRGMDFVRVALESARSADEALDALIALTERFDQGGRMGHRHKSFRYHSSFLIADKGKAWIFETAGNFWAARQVKGVGTISNGLTIGSDYDRVHARAADYATARGWRRPGENFEFARAFAKPGFDALSGASVRQACTYRSLAYLSEWHFADFARALSDHGAEQPGRSWRSVAPCAHASWLPTRNAGQTTGSLVARLGVAGAQAWATGTSSPCLSVFKPAPLRGDLFAPRPVDDARFDDRALWWAHEKLHRLCMEDYAARRLAFAEERERFQGECVATPEARASEVWSRHRDLIEEWVRAAERAGQRSALPGARAWYWSRMRRATA